MVPLNGRSIREVEVTDRGGSEFGGLRRLEWDPYLIGFDEGKPNKGMLTFMNVNLSTVNGPRWEQQDWSMSLRCENTHSRWILVGTMERLSMATVDISGQMRFLCTQYQR